MVVIAKGRGSQIAVWLLCTSPLFTLRLKLLELARVQGTAVTLRSLHSVLVCLSVNGDHFAVQLVRGYEWWHWKHIESHSCSHKISPVGILFLVSLGQILDNLTAIMELGLASCIESTIGERQSAGTSGAVYSVGQAAKVLFFLSIIACLHLWLLLFKVCYLVDRRTATVAESGQSQAIVVPFRTSIV